MYAVILAGGGGTRLWPLSSPERPKPFLSLVGERTLLQLTADRLAGVVEPDSIFVVTDRRYETMVREQLPGVAIVAEPVGRNTTAAIALATVAIERPDDEVMLVLPADQTVEKRGVFGGVLGAAEQELAIGAFGIDSPLVTLGVEPTRAATEFGYLIPDPNRTKTRSLAAFVVTSIEPGASTDFGTNALHAFEEKPLPQRADELWRQGGGIAWNAGMFMWQRRAIRGALEAFAPDVMDLVATGFSAGALDEAYAGVQSISIDYAVMEPAAAAGMVVMGAMDVGWNDLGSWTSLLGELGMPGVEASIDATGRAFQAKADDLLIWRDGSGRLIATPGSDATMVAAAGPVAVLRDARSLQARIEPLLDRCSMLEAHS